MKLSGPALSRRCASRISSVPLVSSSPIESSPTRGCSIPSATWAYTVPSRRTAAGAAAGTRRSRPASSSTAGPRASGWWSRARGDRRPAAGPSAPYAAITDAPVLPALNRARAWPCATASAATRIDARGLRRSASAGDSAMPTTSGASITSRASPEHVARGARARARGRPRGPTSSKPIGRCRAADSAPSTMGRGA